MNQGLVDLVALEGAFGPIDLKGFHAFPHQETVKKVADRFLKEGKFSGPLHAAITNSKNAAQLVGVDDQKHYENNVEAYRKSTGLVEGNKKALSALKNQFNKEKAAVFNQKLKVFDQTVMAYREGSLSLGNYVKHFLFNESEIHLYLKALHLESNLNLKQVELERSHLLSRLLKKLNKQSTTDLLDHSMAYRFGHIAHSDYYEYINHLCDEKGVFFDPSPGSPRLHSVYSFVRSD